MSVLHVRRSRFVADLLAVTIVAAFALYYYRPALPVELPAWQIRRLQFQLSAALQHPSTKEALPLVEKSAENLPCIELEGANGVDYIIKTGATEVMQRLPVHCNTTLKCTPHHLIFSDFGETFDGHEIRDALANVTEDIRLNPNDFDLWRRLKAEGRAVLDPSELSENDHADQNFGGGNPANGGWRLDKFKNLSMLEKTLQYNPDATWYLYTDQSFLSHPTSVKSIVSGSPPWMIGKAEVSGMSTACRAVARTQSPAQWSAARWSHSAWCSLYSSATACMAEFDRRYPEPSCAKIKSSIAAGEPRYSRFVWSSWWSHCRRFDHTMNLSACYPTLSYHHLKSATIGSLWYLKQDWIVNHTEPLRHSDIFKQWVMPQLAHELADWDNPSGDEVEIAAQEALECHR